ncbi:MAG: S-layer homology domain-containing protein [Patescibacteria group bacterium]
MSRKIKSLWSRPLAFFGCTVAAFAFAIVLSPSAFAAAEGTVIAHTGGAQADFNINPLNDTAGEQFIALKFRIDDDETIATDGLPLWIDQLVLAVGGTGATASTDVASAKLYSDAGTTLVSTGTVADATITFGAAADADGVGDLISLASDAGQDYWIYIYMKTGAALTATEGDTYTFSINDTTSVLEDGDAGSSTMRANASAVATVTGTVAVTATKLVVGGASGTQVTGATNELSVAAKDANNNIDEGYTGSKDLIFSGPTLAPDGSTGNIETHAIGTTTATNFTVGVSDATELTLTAKKVEVTTIDVTDGTLSSTGSTADDLDLTVTVGTKNKLMIAQQASVTAAINNNFNPQPIVYITDAYGNVTADTDNVVATDYLAANCSSAGAGTMSGATKAAVAGVASFTALQHDTVETIYIGYTSGALTAACSGTAGPFLGSAAASAVALSRGAQHSDDSSSSTTTTTTTTTSTTEATDTTPATTTTTEVTTTTTTVTGDRYEQAGVSEAEVDSAVGKFSDLQKDNWTAPFIARMRNLGILDGYPDGSVKPDNTINRAELAKIAAKAFGLANATETYTDVADDAWYAPFVGALQVAGASWTTSSLYHPEVNVTRGEAVWVLLKASGVDLSKVTSEKLFPDVTTGHRFAAAITYASKNGVVNGYDNGNFGPGDTLTRGQVAKIVTLIKKLAQ